jgi:hypothetical protein
VLLPLLLLLLLLLLLHLEQQCCLCNTSLSSVTTLPYAYKPHAVHNTSWLSTRSGLPACCTQAALHKSVSEQQSKSVCTPAALIMDKYDKGVLLGRGTFASVFKATHKEVRGEMQHSSSRQLCTLDDACQHWLAAAALADRQGCGNQKD